MATEREIRDWLGSANFDGRNAFWYEHEAPKGKVVVVFDRRNLIISEEPADNAGGDFPRPVNVSYSRPIDAIAAKISKVLAKYSG
jgi:hypothetical protein